MRTSAWAVLADVGPVNPSNGFPVYYLDTTGLALELCANQTGMCLTAEPFINLPISFPGNFGDEMFWWSGGAIIPLAAGGSADLVLALEAAFGGGPVLPGDQISFARVRLRIDAPVAGTYRVIHPYGVQVFPDVAAGTRAINVTSDVGLGAPGVFTGALAGAIGPFLVWDTGTVLGPDGAAYVGDPAVLHAVTGSPFGTNFFRIEGPAGSNLGGPGIDAVETDLFSIMGKVFTGVVPRPLTVNRASYTRDETTGQISVFATSVGNSLLEVSGTGIPATPMVGDPVTGAFFGNIRSGAPSTFPGSVTITNTADQPPTPVNAPLVDEVIITTATYDPDAAMLTLAARSGDELTLPNLTAVGFGPLDPTGATPLAVPDVLVPPERITVVSSLGGTATAKVAVVRTAGGNTPPNAANDPDATDEDVPVVVDVVANDTDADPGDAPDPTTVSIVRAPANGTATLPVPGDGTVTYSPNPNFAGVDTFTYTVRD
ncbi:MAG: Ig-like domain-containing protein, partial [Deferrisomatales bacterium]